VTQNPLRSTQVLQYCWPHCLQPAVCPSQYRAAQLPQARGTLRAEQVVADPTLGQVAMAGVMPAPCGSRCCVQHRGHARRPHIARHRLHSPGGRRLRSPQVGGQLAAERTFLQAALAVRRRVPRLPNAGRRCLFVSSPGPTLRPDGWQATRRLRQKRWPLAAQRSNSALYCWQPGQRTAPARANRGRTPPRQLRRCPHADGSCTGAQRNVHSSLAAVADGILADRTAAEVGGAALLSTGPAQLPAVCTVFCTANRTDCNPTARTKEPVAATAQVRAAFAGQMAAGVDRDARRFFSAAVAAAAAHCPAVPVVLNPA
jgi:hypothetical protein